jgi:hypothetical protein
MGSPTPLRSASFFLPDHRQPFLKVYMLWETSWNSWQVEIHKILQKCPVAALGTLPRLDVS